MENNKIIKVKENLFSKCLNFFKKIWWKKKIQKQAEVINNTELSKEEFFKLYQQAKNNEIDLHMLDMETLLKIKAIQNEEIRIKSNKMQQIKGDIERYKEEISMLQNRINKMST